MDTIMGYLDKVWGALRSFDFMSDLLDVLLVTFLIFELIKLIRGSRTLHLIKGLAFLVIGYGAIKLFDMEASEFIFSKLFENALIILVVLFSPEIRNMLERFGRRSFSGLSIFGTSNKNVFVKETTDTINNFCKAASDLSETKTGALVVFEKEASLQDIINTGTVLDAKSSPELFNGLFFKNSALHDGAVIVRDARVYAAGCILPLTNNNSLDSELGTRHRAALGMSEQTDAVVVVVSEENGYISVARNGELTRDITRGQLREILLKELLPKQAEFSDKDKSNRLNKKKDKKGGDSDEV